MRFAARCLSPARKDSTRASQTWAPAAMVRTVTPVSAQPSSFGRGGRPGLSYPLNRRACAGARAPEGSVRRNLRCDKPSRTRDLGSGGAAIGGVLQMAGLKSHRNAIGRPDGATVIGARFGGCELDGFPSVIHKVLVFGPVVAERLGLAPATVRSDPSPTRAGSAGRPGLGVSHATMCVTLARPVLLGMRRSLPARRRRNSVNGSSRPHVCTPF